MAVICRGIGLIEFSMETLTGTSIWQILRGSPPAFPSLDRNVACDVAIVGAGISGAMVAAHVARAGMSVIVVDRDQPLLGSTMACTGLLQYELDVPLVKLRTMIGAKDADLAYRECYRALRSLPAFAESINAATSLIARPSLYIAGSLLNGDVLRKEARERKSLGIDARYLDELTLAEQFCFRRAGGAILSGPAFAVDPVALTGGCLRDAVRHGARIFGGTEVVAQRLTDDTARLAMKSGPVIRARHVVYATGYEAGRILGFEVGSRTTTYALATTPLANEPWPQSAMVWEASNPYLYVRTTTDGSICVGGADEATPCGTDLDEQLQKKTGQILRKFAELRPDLPLEVATSWSGTFITTRDGLPYIGGVPRFPAATFVLGYSGNGILFSYIAAQMVLDRLQGREHPLAGLVGFSTARLAPSGDILRSC
jgi:glycine/D-amino acid oxidase-like deaminating enzyme